MDEESIVGRHWCHVCSRAVSPITDLVDFKCPHCHDGFIEHVGEEEDNGPQSAETAPTNIDNATGEEEEDTGLQSGETAPTNVDNATAEREQPSSMWAPILLGMLAGNTGRTGVVGPTAVIQLSLQESNGEGERGRERVIIIIPSNRTRPDDDGTGNSSSFASGDYFIGSGLERLLQHLADNDPNRHGTPPARKSAVAEMPTVSAEEETTCAVCLEEIGVGEPAREMPCKHRFHGGCILPWLESHSSCPVCRSQMPVEEEENKDTGRSSGSFSMLMMMSSSVDSYESGGNSNSQSQDN